MNRLLNSHSPHGGEGEGKNPVTEKILLFKRSRQRDEATLARSLHWAQAFPVPSSIPSVCLLWGRKKYKGLSNTKGKKMDRMEGIKGVKSH